MKLSMWMLADKLGKYDPFYDINDGTAAINGVRVFTEDMKEFPDGRVFIGRASVVYGEPRYQNTVLLAHGHDIMFIEDEEVGTILNEVLSVIDFYNAWEASLWASMGRDDAIQQIVDLCGGVMSGPVIVVDKTGQAIAYTAAEGPQMQNEYWRAFYQTKTAPQVLTSSRISTPDGDVVSDWSEAPQIYLMEGHTYIGAFLERDGEVVAAFYMQQFDKAFSQADVQLTEVLCHILTAAVAMQKTNTGLSSTASVLAKLLKGETINQGDMNALGRHDMPQPPFCLVSVHSVTGNDNIVRKNTLLEKVQQLQTQGIFFVYENDVLGVVPYGSAQSLMPMLKSTVNMRHYAVGISLLFSCWEELPVAHSQALYAISQNEGQDGIYQYQDYAFTYILEGLAEQSKRMNGLHPALKLLKEYDQAHGMEFGKTLFCYLCNERQMIPTAKALCIHRNSLKYRISRIRELTDINLEETEERHYILLSYYLDGQRY
jgi:hypothetical protein